MQVQSSSQFQDRHCEEGHRPDVAIQLFKGFLDHYAPYGGS